MRWTGAAVVAATLLAGSQQVYAQTVTQHDFDIPAGSRREVVEAIALTAGFQLSIAESDDNSLSEQAGPVRGRFTLVEALERALANSFWIVTRAGDGQVRIVNRAASTDIVVTAVRVPLRKEDSSLLTRVDTPLRQTPGTVVSVTDKVLKSQNTTSLTEAVRNLPGVAVLTGTPLQIQSRGDSTAGASFTGGLRNATYGGNAPTIDLAAIEVLKGPSSILTGTAVQGGLLNFVPKEATGTSPVEINIGAGTGQYYRGDFDIGGAISPENRLYWRIVGFSEAADHRNEGGNDPFSRTATLMLGYRDNGWKIDARAQYYNTKVAYGDPLRNDEATQSVVPVILTDKPNRFFRNSSKSVDFGLEKDLLTSDDFTLRLRTRARYQDSHNELSQINFNGFSTFGGVTTQSAILNASQGDSRQFSSSTDVYGKLTTGALEQQMIVAFDYQRGSGETLSLFGFQSFPADRMTPVDQLLPIPQEGDPFVFPSSSRRREMGVVFQDQLSLGPVHALLTVRHSWYDLEASQSDQRQTLSKTVPSGGLVYDLTDWLSAYYSYQKSFTPPSIFLRRQDGTLLPPLQKIGHEAGVKADLFGGRVSATADYYRLSTINSTLPDPQAPGFFIPGPGQKVEGIEFGATGNITPSLFVQTGFSYNRTLSETPAIGFPKYQFNIWLAKEFDLGDDDKIDIGIGGNYQSAAPLFFFEFDPAFRVVYTEAHRDYRRVDAAIGYTSGPFRVNLSVNNIFDRFNISNPLNANELERATGRDVRLVLTYTGARQR